MLTRHTAFADATKCVLVSFDSTMRSNLSVGMQIDLICYERDSLEVSKRRRFDDGALVMAKALADAFAAPLVTSTISRLVVDLNRSIGHPQFLSAATPSASLQLRTLLVARYYRPYRAEVEPLVRQAVERGGSVIHLSSHSFTPELSGRRRVADVGLLHDPARQDEAALCARWKASLAACVS